MRTVNSPEYGLGGSDERRRAVASLAAVDLPVGTPGEMKKESVIDPDALQPIPGVRRTEPS
jgi:hypothetical protein